RIEEFVNYFKYEYPLPEGEVPCSMSSEVSDCPWNAEHRLVHIGLQGKDIDPAEQRPSNLVFLVDVSGSMEAPNKLAMLKRAFRMLLDNLDDSDRVALVTYAGSAGLVLPSTPASEKRKIMHAMSLLDAGGSTAGGAGIQLAYKVARENFIEDGNNRVILATDGDFNVGTSSDGDLVRLIESKRQEGVYLTICGFGMGNYKDSKMEQISNAGNGNYFYIDNLAEAKRVFVTDMRATLFTIAKDVKIQVEFNPVHVQSYRLIGYENRLLAKEDFDDDQKDAGELGAGHTVTALYEVVPVGAESAARETTALKYQASTLTNQARNSGDLLTLKLRYKPETVEESQLLERVVTDAGSTLETSSENFRFSAAVAGYGMLLRQSEHKGTVTYDQVVELAENARSFDPHGDREEFVRLVRDAAMLDQPMLEAEK
ncbi:MAG: von Willebrand factor type A domain-containing protein, partial [Bacteroidota bacterium]